jgi:hypothetical protein
VVTNAEVVHDPLCWWTGSTSVNVEVLAAMVVEVVESVAIEVVVDDDDDDSVVEVAPAV